MMKMKLILFFLATSILVTGCGKEESKPKENTAKENPEQLFKQSCIACHGNDLEGGTGPALKTIGSKFTAEQIKEIIENGRGAMPQNLLSGDKAETLSKWLAEKK